MEKDEIKSELEKHLSNTPSTSTEKVILRIRALSALYVAESNKILAESNDRHSKWMRILTGALVLVGILQAFTLWYTNKPMESSPNPQYMDSVEVELPSNSEF